MIEQTLRELLEDKVELDVEGIDRLYLNAYPPRLQTGGGVVSFFKGHRGVQVASTTLMAPMSRDFVAAIRAFAKREGLEIVHFRKGQRKDDETQRRLKDFGAREGVLYIGVAQEKFAAFRVSKKVNPQTGTSFPWLNRSTVLCNHYLFYLVDADFGPLFIKFSAYFPYTARICLNGHEYAKIKQYFKEDRALRTETTINNTRDFALGRRLNNLPALRPIGFAANRRLLDVEKVSQDCQLGEKTFDRVNRPRVVYGQRASALGFGDPRAIALLQALCLFVLLFRNATLRPRVAQLMGEPLEHYTPGRMTYDLRRLRLHGIIERIPTTHRYQMTAEGLRICLFLTKFHVRLIRPGVSQLMDGCPKASNRPVAIAMRQLDRSMDQLISEAKLAA